MKLIFCGHCNDVIKLGLELKYCTCKKSYGRYLEDRLNASISKDKYCIPLGVDNGGFLIGLRNPGTDFNCWVINEKREDCHVQRG